MFTIDGYIVRTKSNDRFYGVDEMREAMADAYLNSGICVRAEVLEDETKHYCQYDFKCKCWADGYEFSPRYDRCTASTEKLNDMSKEIMRLQRELADIKFKICLKEWKRT